MLRKKDKTNYKQWCSIKSNKDKTEFVVCMAIKNPDDKLKGKEDQLYFVGTNSRGKVIQFRCPSPSYEAGVITIQKATFKEAKALLESNLQQK